MLHSQPAPFGHRTPGRHFYNGRGQWSQGSELRKGRQEQIYEQPSDPWLQGTPVKCYPKPRSHFVEPRLKYASREVKTGTKIINAGSVTVPAQLPISRTGCGPGRPAGKDSGRFPKVWEHRPTPQGRDSSGSCARGPSTGSKGQGKE